MQPGRFGGSAQFPRVAGKHWPFISLRVAEEKLYDVRTAGSRRGDRIGLVDVSSDAQHASSLVRGRRSAGLPPGNGFGPARCRARTR